MGDLMAIGGDRIGKRAAVGVVTTRSGGKEKPMRCNRIPGCGIWLLTLLATCLLAKPLCRAAVSDPVVRVLIVTGEDPAHDWRQTTPVLQSLLQEDSRLKVEVLSDLTKLKDIDLKPYSSVVLHFKNRTAAVPGRVAFEHLRQYVHDGGGLVIVHFACGAFGEFKQEYLELAGRVWVGYTLPPGRRQHDPRGQFDVRIADQHHPITNGLTDFRADDELYTCLEGDRKVVLLAEARSPVDDKPYPMALAYKYGEGRAFLCTLGHDVRALQADGVGELYRRGCAWSAGLDPVAVSRAANDKEGS